MIILLENIFLYIKLISQHLVFWTVPTPEESYYTNIGHIYFKLGKCKKAITAFKKSEKSHNYQNLSFSRYNTCYLGYCYLNLGDFKHAIDYFETYLKLNREDYEAMSYLGWCYKLLDEPEAALESYQRALQIEPNLPSLHLGCAQILTDLSQKEEALKHLQIAETSIEDVRDMAVLESLRQKLNGNIHNAIESLKDAISQFHSNSNTSRLVQEEDCYMVLSKYQKEAGDLEEALLTLETTFEKAPYDVWLMNDLAMEYADQQINLEKALKLITDALKYQPDNPLFLDTKGWILFKMGRREDAKATIQQSLRLYPDYKEAQTHYQTIIASKESRSRKTASQNV